MDHEVTPESSKHLVKSQESPFRQDLTVENAKHRQKAKDLRLWNFTISFPKKYICNPEDTKHIRKTKEASFVQKFFCAPENTKHIVTSEEYEITYPIGILDSPATRILVDFLFSYGDFTPQFSTEDLYVNDAGVIKEYWRRLKKSPEVLKELSNWFYGRPKDDTISLSFDNSDGWFTNMVSLVECRNERVKIRRYEPNELNSSDVITHEMTGVIVSYEFSAVLFTIELSTQSPNALQGLIPKVLYTVDDWTQTGATNYNPTFDLGKPYPLAFGMAHRVPLTYVHYDSDNDFYDYIISHGPIEDIVWVYRDGVKVNPDEYTFVKNGTALYNGYAYIRFFVPQETFQIGQYYTITADVKGMTFGESFCERNFATIIKNILSNSTWGLGESVDTTSFTRAASQVSDLCCDGYVAEQKRAIDVLDKLLLACRGKLDRNEAGAWTLTIDMPVLTTSQTFGLNDGLYNNMTLKRVYTTPVAEAIKKVQLSYRYNTWENTYMNINSRDVLSFGETLLLENEFVWEHSTADRITCFLEQMYEMNDNRADVTVTNEGRMIKEYNTMKVLVPHLSVSETYQVRSIKRRLLTFDLTLVKHANTLYTYNAQTLPVDPQEEDLPDFVNPDAPTYEKPMTPISIQGLAWKFSASPSGDVTAKLYARMFKDPDDVNFAYCMVATKLTTETDYQWHRAYESDHATNEWKIVLDFPASTYPGGGAFEGGGGAYKYFDALVKSVNVFGRDSEYITYKNEPIPFKDDALSDVQNLVQSIDGKTFNWSWDAVATSFSGMTDVQDYHVQIAANDAFTTPIVNDFTPAPNFPYITSLTNGSNLFFRVRARNTTLIESFNWTSVYGEVGKTDGGDGSNIIVLPVCDDLVVWHGDFVNIYYNGTTTCVRPADSRTIGKEAHGFVLDDAAGGEDVTVYLPGNVNYKARRADVVGGTIPAIGGYIYLSDNPAEGSGTYSLSPPVTAGHFIQKLGLPIVTEG